MELSALLFALGVTSNYKGFHQTVAAAALAVERPEDMLLVTKAVYPVVARRYHTSWRSVERNIRRAADQAWAHRPDLLSQLAGRELTERPTAREFIAILAGGYGWLR